MKKFIIMLASVLFLAMPLLAEKSMVVTPEQIENGVFLNGMTYDGDVNPAHVFNKEIYKAVKAMPINARIVILFSKALVEGTPKYIAVTLYQGTKVVAVTYYKDGGFHQSYVSDPQDLHFDLKPANPVSLKRLQRDFQNAFGVAFPLPSAV